MVVIPGRGIFLCTPRTGSRAIANALKTFDGVKESREHHVHPEDVRSTLKQMDPSGALEEAYGSGELPCITVIRNPYYQTLSWFGRAVLRHEPHKETVEEFSKFLRTRSVGWYFHDTLNPYAGMAELVKFRPKDLQRTMEEITSWAGLPSTKLERVGGGSSPSPELLNETTKELIRSRFPKDVELYAAHK